MNKTPDQIKLGAECYLDPDGCDDRKCNSERCPYAADILPAEITCADRIITDCLACIRHLEAANVEVLNLCKQLETKCHQLERERDALIEAIRNEGGICFTDTRMPCRYCDAEGKYTGERCHYCHVKRPFGGFNWRGVKEE